MKIVHVIPNLGAGGAERFVVDLLNEISDKHNVFLVTLYDLDEAGAFFFQELSSKVNHISLGKKLGFDPRMFLKLNRVVRKIKPDVVHTHLAIINYLIPTILTYGKTKFFHTIHNDAFKEVRNKKELQIRKFLYASNRVLPITISKESDDSFVSAYNLQRRTLIYNGRKRVEKTYYFNSVEKEIEELKVNKDDLVFLAVGRITRVKNHLMLAEAFKKMVDAGEGAILLIIGNPTDNEGEEILKEIKDLKCNRIHYLGMKSNVSDYMMLSDAFCLSSLYEGMPISLIEAMSCGCIPISTPVGGVPSILKKQLGFMSKDTSAEGLYNELINFLLFKEKRVMVKNIQKYYSENFDISITAGLYVEAYKVALNRGKVEK